MSNTQGKKRPAPKEKESWKNKQGKKVMASSNITSLASKRAFGAIGANSVIKIQKTAYPVPDVLVTKLKTSFTLTMSTGASGAFASSQLYANSCFDPTASLGVNQPRFFDQLMALYKRYTVYGVKARVKILQRGTGAQDRTVRLIAFPSVESSVPLASNYNDAREFPYQMVWDLSSEVVTSATTASMVLTDKQEKSQYFDVGQFFGRDRQGVMDEELFSGTASANPGNILYYYLTIEGFNAAQTDTITCEVQFTQYVSFRGVTMPATST